MTTTAATDFERVPTTPRNGRELARCHAGVTLLAWSLAEGAHVLDVGAGLSTVGIELAEQRSDIHVVNFDYAYSSPTTLARASKDAPDNVEFVAGDATKLEASFALETFDLSLSWWLLPHLSKYHIRPALLAASGMLAVTKVGGLVSTGAARTESETVYSSQSAMQLIKTADMNQQQAARSIAEATRLRGYELYKQRILNEAFYDATQDNTYASNGVRALFKRDRESHLLNLRALPIARVAGHVLKHGLNRRTYDPVTEV